jgi:phage terminase large subunit-like protein
MLPEGIPERTLGWGVLDWGSKMLAQPDGKTAGQLWQYTDEQALFILWFYAVDAYGRFIYQNGILERPKGWGKSPLLAAISCTELMGPTIFDCWSKDGRPIGRSDYSPLVQIAAISDSQANNTMDLVIQMLANGPVMYHYPMLDINLSKITYPGGRKLEKVTASPRGREGNRATFVVMDETGLWVPAEKGPELFEALDRNLGKMNRRWVATTNAHAPGEASVAEQHFNDYYKGLSGEGPDSGYLFDTRGVFVEDVKDQEKSMEALRYVYGDASWVDLENIYKKVLMTREHVARRFYFNQHIEGHTTWLTPEVWKNCREAKLAEKRKLRKSDVIALGFKGNTIRGAALVACRLEDGALFRLGWWENPGTKKGWEVPFKEVDDTVRKTLSKYNVAKLFADPAQYQDIIGRWYVDHDTVVEEFWIANKTKMARAVEQFESAVDSRRVLYLHEDISRHVLGSHTEEVPQGYVLRQETKYTTRYIFGAQAAVLAFEAATVAIEEGALKPKVDDALYTF